MTITPAACTDIDLFADEILMDPYPTYAELRQMGGAVYIERLEAWALPRHADIRTALHDWQTFSSDDGVGLNDVVNGFLVGSVLGSDPPHHDRLRAVLGDLLAPRALRPVTSVIEARAEDLVTELIGRGSFDAVSDLAVALPLSVVFDLIGLPETARGSMLRWADGTFTVFGPMNARTEKALPVIGEMFTWLASLTPDDLLPGSMGRRIFDAAAAGKIGAESCVPLLAAFTTAGMDTTINAIANAIHLFATYPAQWDALRADPERIPGAFNEVLRYDSPVQAFGRRVTRETTVDGTAMPAGSRVILLYGSGNRDESRYAAPDVFDIGRNPVDHLAFGYGVHGCVGQALAKIEGHSLLRALASRVARIETGEPTRHLNNVIRGLERLPVTGLTVDA